MSDTQTIKDKIDIVDFIGEYVQLKPAGINHKGLCPFHHEKSPSFMASRERNSWHCFGCSKGGDVFTFLQEIEGMEFVEALKYLAGRAGVTLENRVSEMNTNGRNRLRDVNTEAARFFHQFLVKMPASAKALEYLRERGLTLSTIEEWQIGFVPDQWDLLTRYLLKKGFGINDLVDSGLTTKREGAVSTSTRGFYDRFRGRIMFPIWDVHGYIVGFTGRVLVETEKSGGKYVNTPQTALFDKSRVIFGLNLAKQAIRAENVAVLVEGQMDVIACHQAGMKNVVATSGTALTLEQIQLLKRYSTHFKMAFDSDPAGQAAAKRGIDLALEAGVSVQVIQIPPGAGKDPDECVKKNPEVWKQSVSAAEDVMEWYFSRAFSGSSSTGPKDKQQIGSALLLEISRIPYPIERDHWLKKLSQQLDVEVAVLREEMDRVKKQIKAPTQTQSGGEKKEAKSPATLSRSDLFSERLLALFLRFPSLFAEYVSVLPESFLSTSPYLELYQNWKVGYTHSDFNIQTVLNADDQEKVRLNVLLLQADEEFSAFSLSEAKKEADRLIEDIQAGWKKKAKEALRKNLDQLERDKSVARTEEEKKLIDQKIQQILVDYQKIQ